AALGIPADRRHVLRADPAGRVPRAGALAAAPSGVLAGSGPAGLTPCRNRRRSLGSDPWASDVRTSRVLMMTQTDTVEALLEQIDGIAGQSTDFHLWVSDQLTWHGEPVSADIAMAVVLDRLLGKAFIPAGFTQGINGRTYHYGHSLDLA